MFRFGHRWLEYGREESLQHSIARTPLGKRREGWGTLKYKAGRDNNEIGEIPR